MQQQNTKRKRRIMNSSVDILFWHACPAYIDGRNRGICFSCMAALLLHPHADFGTYILVGKLCLRDDRNVEFYY